MHRGLPRGGGGGGEPGAEPWLGAARRRALQLRPAPTHAGSPPRFPWSSTGRGNARAWAGSPRATLGRPRVAGVRPLGCGLRVSFPDRKGKSRTEELPGTRAVGTEVGPGPAGGRPTAPATRAVCSHARTHTFTSTSMAAHTFVCLHSTGLVGAPGGADPLAPGLSWGGRGRSRAPAQWEQLKAQRDTPPPASGSRTGEVPPRQRTSFPPGAGSWADSQDCPLPSRPSQSRGPGWHGEQLCWGAVGREGALTGRSTRPTKGQTATAATCPLAGAADTPVRGSALSTRALGGVWVTGTRVRAPAHAGWTGVCIRARAHLFPAVLVRGLGPRSRLCHVYASDVGAERASPRHVGLHTRCGSAVAMPQTRVPALPPAQEAGSPARRGGRPRPGRGHRSIAAGARARECPRPRPPTLRPAPDTNTCARAHIHV